MTDDGGIMDPRWDHVESDATAKPPCEHHWMSIHQPDLPIYWIEQCLFCREFNAERMVQELKAAGWTTEPLSNQSSNPRRISKFREIFPDESTEHKGRLNN